MTINTYSQWKNVRIDEVAAKNRIKSSEWIDSATLICHYGSREIFISTDGGYSYTVKKPAGLFTLGNSSHISIDTGFIVSRAHNAIFKTISAWDSAFPILISNGIDTAFQGNQISFIHFWDSKRGVVVGDSTLGCLEIWTTENGGVTWEKNPCNPEISVNIVNKLYANQFPTFQETENGGWFTMSMEDQYLFRLEDFGKSWKKISVPIDFKFMGKFAFRNDHEGIIARWPYPDSNYTVIAKTTDGGLSWDSSGRIIIPVMDLLHISASTSGSLEGYYLAGIGFFHYDFDSGNYTKMDSNEHYAPNFFNGNVGVSFFSKDNNGYCVKLFQSNWLSIAKKTSVDISELVIYPNPSKGKIYFSSYLESAVVVSGLQGQLLYQGTMNPLDQSIDLPLSPGLYHLRIEGTGVSEFIVVE